MMQHDLFSSSPEEPPVPGLPELVRAIAEHSARPRYTFIVLDLIARVARDNGQAGPLVRDGTALVPIREWLAATIAPSATRHHQRRLTVSKVRTALAARGMLPVDPAEAERLIEAHVSERIMETGMTAVSRAVSELVRAGLVRRHYQGFRVDHENRGAGRHVVYTVTAAVRMALNPAAAINAGQRLPRSAPAAEILRAAL